MSLVQGGIAAGKAVVGWLGKGLSGVKDLAVAGGRTTVTTFKAAGPVQGSGRFARHLNAAKKGGTAIAQTFDAMPNAQKVATVAIGTLAADQGRRALT